MTYSTADVEAMEKCIESIQDGIDSITESVSTFNQTTKNLCDAYHQWHGYDGQLMEDSRRESENIDHGDGNFETIYHSFGVRATQTDDKKAPGFFANIDHDATEIYRTMHGMKSYLEFALQSAEAIAGQKEAVEEGLSEALGGGGSGGSGGGGGDTSTVGSRTPTYFSGSAPSTSGTRSAASPVASSIIGSTIGSSPSSSSRSSSYNPTSTSSSGGYSSSGSHNNSSSRNGDYSTTGGRSGSTSGSSNDYFNKYGDHTSTGGRSGGVASGHSGGGYSGSAGYMGAAGDDNVQKKGLLGGASASIDDIVKGSNKNRVASTSSPLLGNDKISGSTIIPIVGGIGAVGASGLGLTAMMAKKDDDDDDDDVEEYDDPNLTEMEDITKRKEPKIIMTQDDLEEFIENGGSNSS